MATACEIDNTNKETTYTFCFNTTKKIIHVTEEQLNRIPLLSLLVTHNNDFSSIQNENGEYVLDSRIRYEWFIPIFQSITTGHPSALFTELPREMYLWGMLQLYDYLCVNPIPIPLLKDQDLVRTKFDNVNQKKFRVEYRRVKNLLEIRDTAAQFIIALSNNEYNLEDSNTLNNVFSLIMVVLSNPIIFDVGLCYHMLTVIKDFYFTLFSFTQQRQLQKAKQSIESIRVRSLTTLCNDDKLLLRDFDSAFAWKGEHTVIEENITSDDEDHHFNPNERSRYYPLRLRYLWLSRSTDLYYPGLEFVFRYPDFESVFRYPSLGRWYTAWRIRPLSEERDLWLNLHSTMSESSLYSLLHVLRNRALLLNKNPDNKELYIYQIKREQKKMEAKLSRSGHFNTLPKRPKIDKFKHRCGPKAQKHR